MPSRVCDESRIPCPHLPTAAAAGPSSNNWPSSKLSTLASFRHLRLLLLLVFRVINLHQAEQASDISGLDALPVVNESGDIMEGDEMPDAAQLLCSSAQLQRHRSYMFRLHTACSCLTLLCLRLLHLLPEILELMQ